MCVCVCVCVCVCECRGIKREEIEIQKQNGKVFYLWPEIVDFLLIAQLEEEVLVQYMRGPQVLLWTLGQNLLNAIHPICKILW